MPIQVTVSVHVEASRKLCSQVAKGEVDAALIGGEVPIEIRHVLRVSHLCHLSMPTGMLILLPHCGPGNLYLTDSYQFWHQTNLQSSNEADASAKWVSVALRQETAP